MPKWRAWKKSFSNEFACDSPIKAHLPVRFLQLFYVRFYMRFSSFDRCERVDVMTALMQKWPHFHIRNLSTRSNLSKEENRTCKITAKIARVNGPLEG